MSEQARELAELMGWKFNKIVGWYHPDTCPEIMVDIGIHPAYDTDLNAMREVWKVLWDKGLWLTFEMAWQRQQRAIHADWVYEMLNDLPGQVTAAIKVFKEGK